MKNILSYFNINEREEGAWLGSRRLKSQATEHILSSFNPSTEELLVNIKTVDSATYEYLINALMDVAKTWRLVPAPVRGQVVYEIGQRIRKNKLMLAKIISLDMGKSLQEAEGEVQEVIDMADFAVGQSRMLYGKTMHSEREQHRLYEQWHPYGIVGVITAFNFPMAVWAWNAFLALIAGNVVFWKPSSKTPLCALAIQSICAEVLLERGYPDLFALWFPENHAVAELMVDDPRIALVSFTGSTAVGKSVSAKVARRLGRSILELGGNNAVIVDESANLDLALQAVVFGVIGTSGQRCTSTRRLLLHVKHIQLFQNALKKAFTEIKIGNPFDSGVHMGPLIDKSAVQNYNNVLSALKSISTVWMSPQKLPNIGYFVAPVIVSNIDFQHPLVQQETFAPIVYIHAYENFDDAIELQNQVAQGLSSSLFTESLSHAEQFLSSCGSDCGIANINVGTSGAEIGGAFGGEKATGGGREAGSDAWKNYMRRQTNTINWGKNLPLAQGIKFEL